MLLEEGDAIARLATTEAFVDAQVRTHVEAGRLLVMEGTEAEEARTLAFQRHELSYHLLHTGGVLHLLYGLRGDHGIMGLQGLTDQGVNLPVSQAGSFIVRISCGT